MNYRVSLEPIFVIVDFYFRWLKRIMGQWIWINTHIIIHTYILWVILICLTCPALFLLSEISPLKHHVLRDACCYSANAVLLKVGLTSKPWLLWCLTQDISLGKFFTLGNFHFKLLHLYHVSVLWPPKVEPLLISLVSFSPTWSSSSFVSLRTGSTYGYVALFFCHRQLGS